MKKGKDPKYLEFVRTLPCIFCYDPNAEPHHIIGIGMGAMGSKAYDIHTMPLCRECHQLTHEAPQKYPQVKWMIQTQERAREAGVL